MSVRRVLGTILLIVGIVFVALGEIHTPVQACHPGTVTVTPGGCSVGNVRSMTFSGIFNAGTNYRGTVVVNPGNILVMDKLSFSDPSGDKPYTISISLSPGNYTVVAILEVKNSGSWSEVARTDPLSFSVAACPTATPVTPTATPVTPTATPVTPTATPVTPTATATMTNTPTITATATKTATVTGSPVTLTTTATFTAPATTVTATKVSTVTAPATTVTATATKYTTVTATATVTATLAGTATLGN